MCYNPYSLAGKTILVTGAGSGIGRATSVECSKLGARLVLVDINGASLTETMAMLDRPEVEHLSFTVDLCDEKAIEKLVNEIPVLDGVSNNAGITKLSPIQFISVDDLERIHRVNLIAPVLLTKYLVKKKKIAKKKITFFEDTIFRRKKVTI